MKTVSSLLYFCVTSAAVKGVAEELSLQFINTASAMVVASEELLALKSSQGALDLEKTELQERCKAVEAQRCALEANHQTMERELQQKKDALEALTECAICMEEFDDEGRVMSTFLPCGYLVATLHAANVQAISLSDSKNIRLVKWR